jgi:NAD(P)-dependent dehydrogenase (short-subunit alcohol dehydrogenase family)
MELDGKVAVVTGSGNGIGEAIARRFAAEGARVVVTDIEPEAVARVASELGTVGLVADITVPANVRAVAELARKSYGEVDLWLSNAGVAGPRQPGELQDDSLWDLMWRLHVLSHLNAAREVLPSMIDRGDGYPLQTASSVALSTQPDKLAYSVTKHAALALSEWLAVQYRPLGVKVSCFCPGPMRTRMLLNNGFSPDHPALQQALTPEQVADVVTEGIAAERFLIVTRPGAEHALIEKGTDYDAWIAQASAQFLGGLAAGRTVTGRSMD